MLTFRDFKKFWSSNRVGSVFTAHPTFNLNNDAWNNIVNADALIKKRKKFPNIKHRSINKIDLVDEHKAAINAINNFWNVVNELNKRFMKNRCAFCGGGLYKYLFGGRCSCCGGRWYESDTDTEE